MLKFFRRIRRDLLGNNKIIKYFIYAIGEIFLVVIGILIALQINNWNQNKIQQNELDDLMKSISSAIRTDIRYLKLINTGRKNIAIRADSIFNNYIYHKKSQLVFNDYAYVANTFNELKTTIYYQPNTSAFESLKSSIYLSKLYGTDIELLLNSYYTTAERLQKHEDDYNITLNSDLQNWSRKFRYHGADILLRPYIYLGTLDIQQQFLDILNDEQTRTLLSNSFQESEMQNLYDQQILIGEKFIEMVENGEVNFDNQSKIDFSGIFYSYSDVDVLNLLVDGKIPSDFDAIYAQSSNEYYDGIVFQDDYIVLTYPQNTFEWGSPYFRIKALNGRVTEMDFSKYSSITLEMKGEKGGERFSIMMKDKYDLHDGTESRVEITLSNIWKNYKIDIEKFETADMKIIETPLGFVFIGDEGRTIHLRSVQFN